MGWGGGQVSEPMRRHGSWWQENPDGTWLRWDSTSGVWVKQDSPPPPPPQENKPFDLPPPVEWFVDKSTAILAILALIIYGVVRVATDQFYTNLDVTPEEVGLNHTLIIGRAALYCVVIVASILIVEAAWISRTVPSKIPKAIQDLLANHAVGRSIPARHTSLLLR